MTLEVGGGQTIRTFQAEAAFGAALAVIKGTGANQVKLPTAANLAALGISGLAGDPADVKPLNVPVITQGEAEATGGARSMSATACGSRTVPGGWSSWVARRSALLSKPWAAPCRQRRRTVIRSRLWWTLISCSIS